MGRRSRRSLRSCLTAHAPERRQPRSERGPAGHNAILPRLDWKHARPLQDHSRPPAVRPVAPRRVGCRRHTRDGRMMPVITLPSVTTCTVSSGAREQGEHDVTSSDRRADRGTTFGDRLRPRNWSLPVRLIAVLLVPTLLALGARRAAHHGPSPRGRRRSARPRVSSPRRRARTRCSASCRASGTSPRSSSPTSAPATRRAAGPASARPTRRPSMLTPAIERAGPLRRHGGPALQQAEDSWPGSPVVRAQVTEPRPIVPGEPRSSITPRSSSR